MKTLALVWAAGVIGGAVRLLEIDGLLQWIVLCAAAVTALGVLRARVLKPLLVFGRHVAEGVDVLLELREWRREIERRLDLLEGERGEMVGR